MKKTCATIPMLLLSLNCIGQGQTTLSLDSCEAMALRNNHEQRIAEAEVQQAEYEKKAARGMYFPDISIKGAYLRNQKSISLLGEDAMLPIGTMMADGSFGFATPTMQADGTLASSQLNNKWMPQQLPDGSFTAVPLDAEGKPFNPKENPEKLQWKEYTTIPKEKMEADTRNVFVAALNLTQPIYMGGKIVALNRVCNLKKDLAESKQATNRAETLAKVDEAYWRTISLYNKRKAVVGLIDLLEKMSKDVDKMIEAGVATKKDALTVSVKKNEAKMTLLRVDNGISLYKMQLAQLCGMPVDQQYDLKDQEIESIPVEEKTMPSIEEVYQKRSEIKSLEVAKALYDQKVTIARADMLPTVALIGNYIGMNPSLYDGIEAKFGWQWNVGVMVNVPLFHFGANYYKMKAAKSEALVQELKLEDSKEKINLQVNQYGFKQAEAMRKMEVAQENLTEANENLRMAELSFKAGVLTTSDLLAAQTAWLGAQSDKIDAEIEAKINAIYLDKSTGER